MKASEGKIGRIFVIRLEDGDVVPDCIESFAAAKEITTGFALMVGGVSEGQVVVGPRQTTLEKPDAMYLPVDGAHEVVAVGTLAPDAGGKPVLHMHGALGRAGQTMTGCLRPGVTAWLVGEVILLEILGAAVARLPDATSGFELLKILQ
jgi:predicted DNA-binding protein with PD1-like motif